MRLPATLAEQRPLKPADLHRRIVNGRPVWAYSPNAPRRPVSRPMMARLHPGARPVIESLVPAFARVPQQRLAGVFGRTEQAGDVRPWMSTAGTPIIDVERLGGWIEGLTPITPPQSTRRDGIQDTGALYLQAEIMLAAWARTHQGVCDPPDFGTREEDFRGMADERTVRAIKSFQKWAIAHGAELTPDGQLDAGTYALLLQVGSEALAQHAANPNKPPEPPPKSASKMWLIGLAAAAGAAYLLHEEGVF